MQVGVDVTCMHTSFGGRGLSGLRYGYLLKTANFPFRDMDNSMVMENFNRSESAQKIYASRD